MGILAVIGVILLVLGILLAVGAVPGGMILGLVSGLIGVALLVAGSGRFAR